MADDPLKLSGLDAEVIEQAVNRRQKKPESEAATMRAVTNAKKEERHSKPPPAPPPPPPPQEVEKPKDKSALLDKLGHYRERFPDLRSRNKLNAKSTVEEIEDELHFVEQQLGTKGESMSGQIFLAAMMTVEFGTANHFNPLGLNLTGLTQVCRDNLTEVQPILDELMIKYGASMYMSPEMRLVSTVGMMVYTVHAANSGDPTTAQALEKMRSMAPSTKTDL